MRIKQRCASDAYITQLLRCSLCASVNADGCGSVHPVKFKLVGPSPGVFTLRLTWQPGQHVTAGMLAQVMTAVREVSAC